MIDVYSSREISGYICRCQDDALGGALRETLPQALKSPIPVVASGNII